MSKHTHNHREAKLAKTGWSPIKPTKIPATSVNALREAMSTEGVPLTQFNDLLWLMAQESGGAVNLRNPKSGARGLYQLLPSQYGLNPDGVKSFGNAVEECRGGIRYILGRYHNAASARLAWKANQWI
jgi:SLT domain-containing protein